MTLHCEFRSVCLAYKLTVVIGIKEIYLEFSFASEIELNVCSGCGIVLGVVGHNAEQLTVLG